MQKLTDGSDNFTNQVGNLRLYQCCGTVMIYCGSGTDIGKNSVSVPDPDKF
jgi:hypothetical protein